MIDTGVTRLPGSTGLSMSVKVGLPNAENVRSVCLRNTFVIPSQEAEQQHLMVPTNPNQMYELRLSGPTPPMALMDFAMRSHAAAVPPVALTGQKHEQLPTSQSPKQVVHSGSESNKQSRSGHRGKHCRLCRQESQPASSSSCSRLHFSGDEGSLTVRSVCSKHRHHGRRHRISKSVSAETEQTLTKVDNGEKAASRLTKLEQHEEETQTELPPNLVFSGYTNLPDVASDSPLKMNDQAKDVTNLDQVSEETKSTSSVDVGQLVSRMCEMFPDLPPSLPTGIHKGKQFSLKEKLSESQSDKDHSQDREQYKSAALSRPTSGLSSAHMVAVSPKETLINDPAVQKLPYPRNGTRFCIGTEDRVKTTRNSKTFNLEPIYDPRQVVISAKTAPVKLTTSSNRAAGAYDAPSSKHLQTCIDSEDTGKREEQNQNLRIALPSSKIYEMCTTKIVYKQRTATTTTSTSTTSATTITNTNEPVDQVEQSIHVKDQAEDAPSPADVGIRTSIDSEASGISSVMRQKAPNVQDGLAIDFDDDIRYADDLSELSIVDELCNTSTASESCETLVNETSNGCESPLVTMLEQGPRAVQTVRRVQFTRDSVRSVDLDGNSSGSLDGSLVKGSIPRSDPNLRQAFICTQELPEYGTAVRQNEGSAIPQNNPIVKEYSRFHYTVQSDL
ncbi:hypothetical protein M513_02740 [Trichuris suis]|nr:hypothetical protein M513_02740 [Trichuris suis]